MDKLEALAKAVDEQGKYRYPLLSVRCEGDDWADCWDGKRTEYIKKGHMSDCAQHNMPAYPNGACNCGVWEDCKMCDGSGYRLKQHDLLEAVIESCQQHGLLRSWIHFDPPVNFMEIFTRLLHDNALAQGHVGEGV